MIDEITIDKPATALQGRNSRQLKGGIITMTEYLVTARMSSAFPPCRAASAIPMASSVSLSATSAPGGVPLAVAATPTTGA